MSQKSQFRHSHDFRNSHDWLGIHVNSGLTPTPVTHTEITSSRWQNITFFRIFTHHICATFGAIRRWEPAIFFSQRRDATTIDESTSKRRRTKMNSKFRIAVRPSRLGFAGHRMKASPPSRAEEKRNALSRSSRTEAGWLAAARNHQPVDRSLSTRRPTRRVPNAPSPFPPSHLTLDFCY